MWRECLWTQFKDVDRDLAWHHELLIKTSAGIYVSDSRFIDWLGDQIINITELEGLL